MDFLYYLFNLILQFIIYYEVQFNPEFSTYTITRVYKVSSTDRIHDKADVLP